VISRHLGIESIHRDSFRTASTFFENLCKGSQRTLLHHGPLFEVPRVLDHYGRKRRRRQTANGKRPQNSAESELQVRGIGNPGGVITFEFLVFAEI
jgi:hypothetical protein